MKKLITFYLKLCLKEKLLTIILCLFLFYSPSLFAADVLIGQYEFTGGSITATNVATGITLSDIMIGSGITASYSGDALVTSNWNTGTGIASPNFKTVQFTITKGTGASQFDVNRVDVTFKRSVATIGTNGIIQLNFGTSAYPTTKTYAISNASCGTLSFATYPLTENTASGVTVVNPIPSVSNATAQYIAIGASAANTAIQLTIDKIEVFGTVTYAGTIAANKASISLKVSKTHSLATPVVINGSNLTNVTNVSLTGAGASYFSIDNSSITAATLNAGTTPTINVTASSTLPIGTTTANLHLESVGATSLDIPISATCDLFYEDFSNYDATANSNTTLGTMLTITDDVSLSLVSGWAGHKLYQYKAATPNNGTVCLASTALDLAYLTTPVIDLSQPFKVAFKSRNLTGTQANTYKVFLDGTELMYEGLDNTAVLADVSTPTFVGTSSSKLTFSGQNIAANNILFDAIVVNNTVIPDVLNLASNKIVNFGSLTQGSVQTINIPIQACNLTDNLTLSVTGTDFSLPSGTTVLQATALAGTTIPVTFTAPMPGAEITATLTIASSGMTSRTITLKGTPIGIPTITASATTLTEFGYAYNAGPSTSKNFTISGADMSAGITVTPTTNYEVSADNSTFSSSAIVIGAAGTIGSTTVHVRLKTGLSVANYNGEVVTLTSTNATQKDVTCSGGVTKATPTISVSGTQSFTYTGAAQGPSTITYGGVGTTSLLYTNTDGAAYSSATAPTNAGNYKVVASATATTNYNAATSADYTFSIAKVALTITAGNQSVAYGTAVASVTAGGTYTPSGFVNSEGAGVISGSVSYSSTFTNSTASGTSGVTITPIVSGLSATNYSFTPAVGTISILEQNTVPVAATQNLGDLAVDAGTNLTVSNNGTLTVNSSPKVNSVTVDAGGKLNVNSQITVETVTLKAGKDASTFSAKIDADINATTVRLFKTIDDTKWYFMSFPCDVTVAEITKSDGNSLGTLGDGGDWFIKYYDGQKRANFGTGSNWKHIAVAPTLAERTILQANKGYIFGLKTLGATYNVELSIPLTPSVLHAETDGRTVPVSAFTGDAGGNNYGWNLIGLPYLSNFNGNGAKTSATHMSFIDGNNITYTDVSNAESYTIPPMSAYFVQVGSGTTISFNYLGRQGAKTTVDTDLSDKIQINFASSTGIDKTNLIMDNNQSTAYEIGQDYEKMIGIGTDKPQVYTMLGGVNYSYNALPMTNVVNLPIGFYTKTAGTTTISVDATQAPSLSKLLLTDNGTNPATVTNLLTSNYTFTAAAGTNNSRFAITAQRVPTAIENETDVNAPQLSIVNCKLSINNLVAKANVRVFDAIGRMVINKTSNNTSLEINLSAKGIYMVKIEAGGKNWLKKIIF